MTRSMLSGILQYVLWIYLYMYMHVGIIKTTFLLLLTAYVIIINPFTVPLLECNDRQFTCADHRYCIPLNWKCDGERDCRDNSDEEIIECGT